MKKIFTCIAIVSVILFLFTGCQTPRDPNVLYDDALSEELKEEISEVFLQRMNYGFSWNAVEPYLGTINGCVILIERGRSIDCELWAETIAGYTFEWGHESALYAYRNGEICYLREAYDNGWLTKEHIGKIHAQHENIIEKVPSN